MSRDHLLVIDQGTTSTRVVVFDVGCRPCAQTQVEVAPMLSRPGRVEHDAAAIVGSLGPLASEALVVAGVKPSDVAAVGITNQRETIVVWDRADGRPIAPAIVWQDRRTSEFCERHKADEAWLSARTGLVLDPYFSATKLAWLLDHVEGARARAETGAIAAGTIDSFLIWNLTGGRTHATDVTNASRTLLMDLRQACWDDELCSFFRVPKSILPRIMPSAGVFGMTRGLDWLPDGVPIAGVAGDQQASLAGQGCLAAGEAKCTYGTGAFLLVHTGGEPRVSRQGLITTRAANDGDSPQYALEGSVFVAGAAVQWFRDGLKAVGAAHEIDRLCLDANPNSEVVFVPALTGLGAPHWNPEARGTIFGLTRATTVADLARAVLDGVAYQVADLIEAMAADLGASPRALRVDGGMARSDPFLQFQADLLDQMIARSPQAESTALGAALLAGVGIGLWPSLAHAAALLPSGGQAFEPNIDSVRREQLIARWCRAIQSVNKHYE